MSEKIFVAYCTSGLGNRLRPLAAAIAYCQLTGRKLRVYWDSITPNGCLTPLERLYQNQFEPITLEEIEALSQGSVSLYTEKGPGHGVKREAEKFGRDQLLKLSRESDPKHAGAVTLDDPADAIIVYDNDYLPCVPRELSIQALRSLQPAEDIRAKVLRQAAEFGLTLQTKGVHARGTDFGLKDALAMYAEVIKERVGISEGEKFFLSTEDKQLEAGLRELFPAHILSRDDRLHLELNAGKSGWFDPDSYTISADHGVDALTDVYMLSCVNLVVFHPGSTFAEISRHLHGVLHEPGVPFERAKREFIERAKQLLPRGDNVHKLEIQSGECGPKATEECTAAFMYWETLGYQIPFLERLFMHSANNRTSLHWDGGVFNLLAALPYDQFPRELFSRICPFPEAWGQIAVMRSYITGKKILVLGADTFWVELLCTQSGAAEVCTVEYRPIHWSEPPKAKLKTLTWDAFTADLDSHRERYDLVLSYSTIAHAGLGRYGDRITPLGDLFTFMLMANAMKPTGMCSVAVPTGKDLTHFNAHRIYGPKRIRAMELVSGLKFFGIAGPDTDYLAADAHEPLRAGWSLQSLSDLPMGTYRQPILCFCREDAKARKEPPTKVPHGTKAQPAEQVATELTRPLSIVILDEGGSMKVRGRQASSILIEQGQRNVTTRLQEELARQWEDMQPQTLLFIKEFPRHLRYSLDWIRALKARGHRLVCDMVDTFCFSQMNPLTNLELLPFYSELDAMVHCSQHAADRLTALLPQVQHWVLPHQWDADIAGLTAPPNRRGDKLYYCGNQQGLALNHEALKSNVDIQVSANDFWTGLQYRAHLSVRLPDSLDFEYKPASKLATAAASGALLVSSRDPAVEELVGKDYPYFVTSEDEVNAIANQMRTWTEDQWSLEEVRVRELKDRLNPTVIAANLAKYVQALNLV